MLKILGDICLADGYFDRGKGIGSAIATGKDPFVHLSRKVEDFWIGNFECVCAESNNQSFVIAPRYLELIQHLDMYGVANNHSMQIGADGYRQTLEFLRKKGVKYVGSNDARSTIFIHQNKKIGIIAFCMRPDNFSSNPLYWHLPELSDVGKEVCKLSKCDYRIAFIHWGYEFINRPNIEQRQLAHWLIDMGVDLIVGMHPHVAQGSEVYKNKHIFYSLGNSVFNMPWEPTKYGLLINVDFSGKVVNVWAEYTKIGSDGFPSIATIVPEEYQLSYLNSLLDEIVENELYFSEARRCYQKYKVANRKAICRRMLSMPLNEKLSLVSDFVKRRILK